MEVFKRSYILKIQVNDIVKTYQEKAMGEQSLKIEFNILSSANNVIPEAEITIYGLNNNDMSVLESANINGSKMRDNAISLEAGYYGNVALLVKGSFTQVQTDYNTLGNKVTMKVISGVANNLKNNKVATSLSGQVDFKQICEQVAINNNVTLFYNLEGKRLLNDYSFKGTPFQQMLDLRTYYNDVLINIDSVKEVLNVIKKEGRNDIEPYVLSNQTGLIGKPIMTSNGLEILSLLNTNFAPNRLLKLKNNNLNFYDGVYKIVEVRHFGSNQNNDWLSKILVTKV